MSYRIILVHGFFKDYNDMEVLEDHLIEIGYKVDNLNFPLTFPKLEISVEMLKNYLLNLKKEGLSQKDEIVLIGYGFGGILIEQTLRLKEVKNIVDKVILIACPIKDSTLHRRLKRIFPFIDFIFKPLGIYSKTKKEEKYFDDNIEVGLIIATETYGFFGKFLGEFNDGYVDIKDTNLSNARDKILIPISHNEIHKKIGTARYINNFISKGKFRIE